MLHVHRTKVSNSSSFYALLLFFDGDSLEICFLKRYLPTTEVFKARIFYSRGKRRSRRFVGLTGLDLVYIYWTSI